MAVIASIAAVALEAKRLIIGVVEMAGSSFLGGAIVGIVAVLAVTTIRDWRNVASHDEPAGELSSFVGGRQIGSSQDYWLVKGNMGAIVKVALFFGCVDDFAACKEFAEAHKQMFALDTYSCFAAN